MSLIQNIANAETDALALSSFLNDNAQATVPRRIAGNINTLQYYIDYLNALKTMVANPTGTVTINGATMKTIAQSVKDALETAGVQNGVSDLLVAVKNSNMAGAVPRTQADKNAERVSVKDFGAKGDGVTDDTQAILKATAVGKTVIFPAGIYLISDTILQAMPGQRFIGDGMQPYKKGDTSYGGTVIIQTNPSKDIFKTTEFGFTAQYLHLTYQSKPKIQYDSPAAFNITNASSYIDSVFIDVCPYAFKYIGSSGNFLSNFDVQNAYYCALYVKNTNDIAISNGLFVAAELDKLPTTTICPQGVVWYEDFVQAVQIVNVDILGGVKSFGSTSTATDISDLWHLSAFCKFINVYFDSSHDGAWIDKCVGLSFINCWFSNRPGNGATVGGSFSDNVKFIGCNFKNCGGNGLFIAAGAVHTLVEGCAFISNSTTTSGNSHGIYVQNNAAYFSIINCVAKNAPYFSQTQGYGLLIDSGTSGFFKVINNDFSGNLTGGMLDVSNPGLTKQIAYNFPIVTNGAQTITPNASPFTYTNNTGAAQSVLVKGGTVSSITLYGGTVYTATNQSFVLPVGQATTITYSSPPQILTTPIS